MAKLTYAQVSKLLTYDPDTGKLFWKERPVEMFSNSGNGAEANCRSWNKVWAGNEAFTARNSSGYLHGNLIGSHLKAHRVAWLLHHGEWPEHTIDHINGDTADNRIANLRDVPHKINLRNQKRAVDNKSGVVGVCLNAKYGWQSFITVDAKVSHLGFFADKADAIAARKLAEVGHGFHANHGR